MGRDDSWPATVPSVVLSLRCSLLEKASRKYPEWRNRTSNCESDGRFWIGKPRFQFEFPSNHMSISLSFGDICAWQRDRETDNADQYYSWPPHCGRTANKWTSGNSNFWQRPHWTSSPNSAGDGNPHLLKFLRPQESPPHTGCQSVQPFLHVAGTLKQTNDRIIVHNSLHLQYWMWSNNANNVHLCSKRNQF